MGDHSNGYLSYAIIHLLSALIIGLVMFSRNGTVNWVWVDVIPVVSVIVVIISIYFILFFVFDKNE